MKKVLLLSMAFVALGFSTAFAQGPYLGADVVYNIPVGSDIRFLADGPGLDFRFGYDFGPIAVEGNLMGSRHRDTTPGFGHGDFTGFSLDLRVPLSGMDNPNQVYLLAGFGSYAVYQFDPFVNADTELHGTGWNVGAGLEHYVDTNLAFNLGVIYRFIRYDEFDVDGLAFSLAPEEDGNTLTIQAGVMYHF